MSAEVGRQRSAASHSGLNDLPSDAIKELLRIEARGDAHRFAPTSGVTLDWELFQDVMRVLRGRSAASGPAQPDTAEETEIKRLADRLEQGWRDGGVMRSHAGDLKRAADTLRTLLAALNIAAKQAASGPAPQHTHESRSPADSLPVCYHFEGHSICILLCARCFHRYDEHRRLESVPAPVDDGVEETERRHSAACRADEDQRRREAEALQAGFELGRERAPVSVVPKRASGNDQNGPA